VRLNSSDGAVQHNKKQRCSDERIANSSVALAKTGKLGKQTKTSKKGNCSFDSEKNKTKQINKLQLETNLEQNDLLRE